MCIYSINQKNYLVFNEQESFYQFLQPTLKKLIINVN